MVDLTELNKLIDSTGHSKARLAKGLGIHRTSLYNKLKGRTQFTDTELIKLADLLRLTDAEKLSIFFPEKLQNIKREV